MKFFVGFGVMYWALFLLYAIMGFVHIGSLPGLMGDEASEAENVFQIVDTKKIAVVGERSYIGPAIDYVRIPFVLAFGYTSFALRLVMYIASLLFFLIVANICIKVFGKEESLLPLIFLICSPIYFTQMRLAWAITLLPLCSALLIYSLLSNWKQKYLLAGLIAGIGLSNHLLFLPSLVAIILVATVLRYKKLGILLKVWPIVIGFMAGFAMQFAILQTYPDDQGSQKIIAETFMTRLQALPSLLPEIVSGSSYVASYTGHEFTPITMTIVVLLLSVLVLVALTFSRHRKISWIIFIGLLIYLFVLLRIIDRFSFRYFTVIVLGIWFLAGMGFEAIVAYVRKKSLFAARSVTVSIALLFIFVIFFVVILPFVKTGGSTNTFSLGNRTDSASALVDTKPLLACLHRLGPVYSENVHIYNRMLLWSREYHDVIVPDEDHKKSAKYLVEYRLPNLPKDSVAGEVCPELSHFRITKK